MGSHGFEQFILCQIRIRQPQFFVDRLSCAKEVAHRSIELFEKRTKLCYGRRGLEV